MAFLSAPGWRRNVGEGLATWTSCLAFTSKKAGKVVSKGTIEVSGEGKTSTVKYTFTTPEGKTETGTKVYEKQ